MTQPGLRSELDKAQLALAARQRLIDDLYFLFTHDPAEIAAQFGESRCVDDSCRINYALEWLADFVSEVE